MHIIKNRTHYANDTDSVITSYTKPEKLVDFAKEKGYKICGICDYGNISGAIKFIDSCKKADIKPIVSCEMKLAGYKCMFIAQNTEGWYNLIKLNSHFLESGDISVSIYQAYSENIILCLSEQAAADFSLVMLLGKDNVYQQHNIRKEKEDAELKQVSVFDSRYVKADDLDDYKILLSCKSNIKVKNVVISQDFCLENNYNREDPYQENWDEIISKVGDYNILNKPQLPKFCEGSELDALTEMCRDGWRSKISKIPKHKHSEYAERIKMELSVIKEANLAGYFLIVQDFVNYCKNKKILIGPARGSAGGCLISFLLNITSIDPIEYDLLFSRFYNKGRNTGDHVEYPDIDIDFPINHRSTVIEYIRDKYGHDRVGQVITFGALKGRGALKEVLRAHAVMDSKSIDEITTRLPQDSEINDKMEDDGYESIIEWTLDKEPDMMAEWCMKNPEGEYTGELAKYFKQAARIEGTYKSTGKHAAGLVIGHTTLHNVYPMCKEKKGNEYILALEMNDLAKAGGVKFDILGVAALDKLMLVNELLRYGNVTREI